MITPCVQRAFARRWTSPNSVLGCSRSDTVGSTRELPSRRSAEPWPDGSEIGHRLLTVTAGVGRGHGRDDLTGLEAKVRT